MIIYFAFLMKKSKKLIYILSPFFLFYINASAQSRSPSKQKESSIHKNDTSKNLPAADLIETAIRIFNIDTTRKPRSAKKINFSFLPTGAAVPGGGAAVVTTLNAA